MTNVTFPRLLSFCLVLGVLASCGSDQGPGSTTNALKATASAVTGGLWTKQKPATAGLGLTRAALANIVTPVDLVTIESRGVQGVIAKIATNRGVETWSSLDKKTISLRGGVIVATRGLGEDLMSASVPQTAQLRSAGASFQRVHTVLTGDDKPDYQRFDCTVSARGAETITVVERTYPTQHMTENCIGPSGRFSNDYWFQSGEKLRKSRQWISKTVGFVVIEHLQ